MRIIVFIFLLVATSGITQNKYAKQFSLITDNDLYTSVNRDRYYTSGIFLSYKHASKKTKKNEVNRIYEWLLGHEMYTPQKAIVTTIAAHDRPFAGYLYAGFGITRAYQKSIFKTNVELGVIGPEALGEQMQEFIHNIYGFRKAIGWKYQIQTALGLNLNVNYTQELYTATNNMFDISWANEAALGTVFTNVYTGFFSRIAFKPLQKINNSIAFDTHLRRDTSKREIESYAFIKPMLGYNMYDATVQGSFLNNNSVVTKELIPIVFHLQIGIQFTANRFNFGYTYHYTTNSSKNLVHSSNTYGTILIHYLFR